MMSKITDKIERLLFGATAEERVAVQIALVEQQVSRMLERAFAALNESEEDDTDEMEASHRSLS